MLLIGIGTQLSVKEDNEKQIDEVYDTLAKLAKGRNCFVITSNTDQKLLDGRISKFLTAAPKVEGQEKQWEAYMNWLSCSLTHELTILELGEGFADPMVMRWPFEKVLSMHQKATLIRVHPMLYQVPADLNGRGIVVRSRATTGGTDIVAMILQKYCHIRFSKAILLVDGIVVGFGLLVIGFGIGNPDDATQPSWHLSFYSLIAIFVTSRVLAYVINGEKNDKILFVISDMRLTALHDYILKDLDRTATCIKSSGLYTNVDKEMLFLVVSYKEVVGIKQKIREVDPKAFVVVTDAYDAFGEGWKELPMAGEVQPE